MVIPWYRYPRADAVCRSPQTGESAAETCTVDSHGDSMVSCLARDCYSTAVSSSAGTSSQENGSVLTCCSTPLKDARHTSCSERLLQHLKAPASSVVSRALQPDKPSSKPVTSRARRQAPNSHHSAVPAFLTDAHSFKKTVRALQGEPCAGFECDSEAPTSDLFRSPPKSLSRSTSKSTGTSNLALRLNRSLRGASPPLQETLGSAPACYSVPDTPRLHLGQGTPPLATLDTPTHHQPRLHPTTVSVKEVSFLMSRHLDDAQAMAATSSDRRSRVAAETPRATVSGAQETGTCSVADLATSLKFSGHKPCGAAVDLTENAVEGGGVGEVSFNLESCGCGVAESQRRYNDLLAALTAAGVHACYEEDAACPGWRITHMHAQPLQNDSHACGSSGRSPERTLHPCGDATEACKPCNMHEEVATGVLSCTASSESASTTARGADCMSAMHEAEPVGDAEYGDDPAPQEQCLPCENLQIAASEKESSERVHRESSCALGGATHVTNALGASTVAPSHEVLRHSQGAPHQQFSCVHCTVRVANGADLEGEEGSDEKVLHHLSRAKEGLADFMHGPSLAHAPPAPAPVSAVGDVDPEVAHAGQHAAQDDSAESVHVPHASPDATPTDSVPPPPPPLAPQPTCEDPTPLTAVHEGCALLQQAPEGCWSGDLQEPCSATVHATHAASANAATTATVASSEQVKGLEPEDSVHTGCEKAASAAVGSAQSDVQPAACMPQRASVAAADAAAAAVALQGVANQLRGQKGSTWRGLVTPKPSPRAADRSAVSRHALRKWSAALDALQHEQAGEQRDKDRQHRLALWKVNELSVAQMQQPDATQSAAGGASEDAACNARCAAPEPEGVEEGSVWVVLRGLEGGSTVAVDMHVVPAAPDSADVQDSASHNGCSEHTTCHDDGNHMDSGLQQCTSSEASAADCNVPADDSSCSSATEAQARIAEADSNSTVAQAVTCATTEACGHALECTERDESVVQVLCRSLYSMMHELETETAQRMKLERDLSEQRAAQQRQNAALAKFTLLMSGNAPR